MDMGVPESLMDCIHDEFTFRESASKYQSVKFDLKKAQDNFAKTLYMDDEEIEVFYIKLALDSFHEGVSYSQYVEFFTLFTEQLASVVSQKDDAMEYIERIYEIYSIIKNANAKGYLEGIIEQDLYQLGINIDGSVSSDYVKAHYFWLQALIGDMQNGTERVSLELNPKKCVLGLWLQTTETDDYFTPTDEKEINATHNNIHGLADSIYGSLRENKYDKVLMDYLMLTRLSLYLITRLGIYVTEKNFIEKMQTDALTGIENRQSMNDNLPKIHEQHRVNKKNYVMALIDIDFFKNVNDTYGHLDGDIVLKEMTDLFKKSLRKDDRLYRYGGEEFLVLLLNTTLDDAYATLEKLRQKVEKHAFALHNDEIHLTVSLGMCEYHSDRSLYYDQVLKSCDENLYEAKRLGRNQVLRS